MPSGLLPEFNNNRIRGKRSNVITCDDWPEGEFNNDFKLDVVMGEWPEDETSLYPVRKTKPVNVEVIAKQIVKEVKDEV